MENQFWQIGNLHVILGIIPQNTGTKTTGEILFKGTNLLSSPVAMHRVRGKNIAMISGSMTSLNPQLTVGRQIMEAVILHKKLSKKEARQKTLDLLSKVGISDPEIKIDSYPMNYQAAKYKES